MDQAEPQVFLTLLDKDKKREAQRMLTRKKGALGEISAVWVGDGWVVAWLDGRSGNLEVYASKIDARLNRASRERVLSPPRSSASEVQLAFDGTALYAVYADARGNDGSGRADVYARALSPKDATPTGDELRLSNSPEHSFSPRVAARTGGFSVAWLERGNDGQSDRILARAIGANGLGDVVSRPLTDGEAGGLGLFCREAECRLALPIELQNGREAVLGVVRLDASGFSPVTRVLDLDGARGVSVAPVVDGDVVSFVSATNDRATIRSARIAW
jgi:hypothetical protein